MTGRATASAPSVTATRPPKVLFLLLTYPFATTTRVQL